MKTRKDFTPERKNEVIGTATQITGKNTPESDVKYQCPMKCHGEEVFNEPGLCPDSKMQLIPVRAGHIFY
jgi:hypothetical protein